MSSKMNQIPFLSSYEDVRAEMNRDLQYRLNSRTAQTSLGRPLYYRIKDESRRGSGEISL